jgi:hypothetical protein
MQTLGRVAAGGRRRPLEMAARLITRAGVAEDADPRIAARVVTRIPDGARCRIASQQRPFLTRWRARAQVMDSCSRCRPHLLPCVYA